MTNNTIKSGPKQHLSRQKQLEAAKNTWLLEAAASLSKEKSDLGYKEFTWDAFLEIVPSVLIDSSKQSQIIALQDKYKELKEQEEILWSEDKVIEEFNKKHAIVHVEQTYVLTKKHNT